MAKAKFVAYQIILGHREYEECPPSLKEMVKTLLIEDGYEHLLKSELT